MHRALAGDQKAYRDVLETMTPFLRSYFERRLGKAHAADTEDLVQDTLLAVHTRRESYDQALPFTAWLHGIARYKLVDHFRRMRTVATVPVDEIADMFTIGDEDAIAARLDVERILASL